MKIEGTKLVVENAKGEYLGQVEPKHGQRLIKFMQGGNRYTAAIINASEDGVTVIIRETYQDPSQAGRLSFPPRGVEPTRSYISDRIIRRELEYEESLSGEPTYTIVGGDEEGEILTEESSNIDNEDDTEE